MSATLMLKQMILIDGTGRPPQEQSVLVIWDGRIAYVGDEAGWAMAADEPITVLDLPGRYVLPGLIDCHVHLAGDGAPDSRLRGDMGWATLLMLKHAQIAWRLVSPLCATWGDDIGWSSRYAKP